MGFRVIVAREGSLFQLVQFLITLRKENHGGHASNHCITSSNYARSGTITDTGREECHFGFSQSSKDGCTTNGEKHEEDGKPI